MHRSLALLFGEISIGALAIFAYQTQPWQLGPFSRPVDTPVITPNRQSLFLDPVSGNSVQR